MQDIIYLMLNVSHQIDVTHNWHLEGFLASMGDNGKYVAIVRTQKPLVEE